MTANPGGGDYRPNETTDGFGRFMDRWLDERLGTPASVAQEATDATETPARTPGGSGTAEARTEAQGETDAAGMDNQGAQIEAWRTRALTAEADAIRLTGRVAELRAQMIEHRKTMTETGF